MRGFAQTAHCPRCEMAHPTGGDVAPVITCTRCGLGFDPRPRAPRAIVRTPRVSLVHEQVSASDALLSVRDSVWTGVIYLAGAALFLWLVLANAGAFAGWRVLAYAAVAAWTGYVGGGHLVNRINVLVTRDRLDGWERPLPRHGASVFLSAGGELEVRPMGRTYDVLVDGVRLVNVPHRELAEELVERIEAHRVRLAREQEGAED